MVYGRIDLTQAYDLSLLVVEQFYSLRLAQRIKGSTIEREDAFPLNRQQGLISWAHSLALKGLKWHSEKVPDETAV